MEKLEFMDTETSEDNQMDMELLGHEDIHIHVEMVVVTDPIKIFPEEIWLDIFDLLMDPNDLENCSKSCPYFHKLLEAKRTFFLFSKVFKLIDSNYQWSTNDILTCRLVSSFWKKVADSTLESRKYRYNFLNDNKKENCQFEEFLYTFQDSTAISIYKRGNRYMERMWQTQNSPFYQSPDNANQPNFDKASWSPFPSRHIIICDHDIPYLPENPQNMGMGNYRHPTFSVLIRSDIWYLDVWMSFGLTFKTWYYMLDGWVYHTPNVKVLQFKYPSFRLSEEEKAKLEEKVGIHPFRNLSKLEMLTMQNVPMPIIRSVLRANQHVKMLQILRTDFSKEVLLEKDIFNRLVGLEKLSISLCTMEEFEYFEELSLPSLKTLYLNLERIQDLTSERVFRAVERFGDTLTNLTLTLPRKTDTATKSQIDKVSTMEYKGLSLPKVGRLNISSR